MKLSTKGRYAVTAMLDLAIHQSVGYVTLADISKCQGISLSYLEQLFAKLRSAGLVQGVRGPGGGYSLARKAEEISIADIILSVDERIDITHCDKKGDCQDGEKCLTHDLWIELSNKLKEYLDSVYLADLISQPVVKNRAVELDTISNRYKQHAVG